MTIHSTAERLELLQSMAIFGGLKTEALKLILGESDRKSFSKGAYFFREGDPGENIYLIEQGTAIVERLWEDQPIVLARVGASDCFGEMSLIDFQRRFASVRAETDCQVIEIPFGALGMLCKRDVQQYSMVMMNLGREVSRRLRVAGDRLFRFQQETGRQWFDEELTGET